MQVTVEIPDQFIHQLVPEGITASRVLLEETVAGAYRNQRLTVEQVRQLLGFGTRMQATTFLLEHAIYNYTAEEFEKDMATFERMFPSLPEQQQA